MSRLNQGRSTRVRYLARLECSGGGEGPQHGRERIKRKGSRNRSAASNIRLRSAPACLPGAFARARGSVLRNHDGRHQVASSTSPGLSQVAFEGLASRTCLAVTSREEQAVGLGVVTTTFCFPCTSRNCTASSLHEAPERSKLGAQTATSHPCANAGRITTVDTRSPLRPPPGSLTRLRKASGTRGSKAWRERAAISPPTARRSSSRNPAKRFGSSGATPIRRSAPRRCSTVCCGRTPRAGAPRGGGSRCDAGRPANHRGQSFWRPFLVGISRSFIPSAPTAPSLAPQTECTIAHLEHKWPRGFILPSVFDAGSRDSG